VRERERFHQSGIRVSDIFTYPPHRTEYVTGEKQRKLELPGTYIWQADYQSVWRRDMNEFSILIGGKAGDGINSAGLTIAQILNRIGYRVYMYFDYPSLIKGGHNFCIIRASEEKIGAHRDRCDFLLALNQDTIDLHRDLTGPDTVVIYDSSRVVNAQGTAIPVPEILSGESAPAIMGNSCIIGAFASAAGIGWDVLETVFRRHIPKGLDQNLKVAEKGYRLATEKKKIKERNADEHPLLSGNEAIALGLCDGGLDTYIAYPMTPTSNVLHVLAGLADELGVTVVHPENEIAVMLMALGSAYAGKKTAVGTSGGGFCLMTEGFSLSGMSEVPVIVVMGQRTGPSTGVPTYTAQSDLNFMMYAGQGEFPRFIVAPGDTEEAFEWSSAAVKIAWKCQVPAVILVDKTLCEGTYSFFPGTPELPEIVPVPEGMTKMPESAAYRRYAYSDTGISPVIFPPVKEAVIKVNGYAHDEAGITTEKEEDIVGMTEKRLKKQKFLEKEISRLPCVYTGGKSGSRDALVCWGSNKGVCHEVAVKLGIRVVQPLVLSPFPKGQVSDALSGVDRCIVVEDSTTGQLPQILACHGIRVHHTILKYDGRPFSVEGLEQKVREVL
jgi:2-oxoglutarate ferredoxin oxidoreductase subunit alpha